MNLKHTGILLAFVIIFLCPMSAQKPKELPWWECTETTGGSWPYDYITGTQVSNAKERDSWGMLDCHYVGFKRTLSGNKRLTCPINYQDGSRKYIIIDALACPDPGKGAEQARYGSLEEAIHAPVAYLMADLIGSIPFTRADPDTGKLVEWHRARDRECARETEREYAAMAKEGWCCDPPITMGMSWMSFGKDGNSTGYSRYPCGYTNGYHFSSIHTVSINGKICEVTSEQADSMYVEINKGSREYSQDKANSLYSRCAKGELPTFEFSK